MFSSLHGILGSWISSMHQFTMENVDTLHIYLRKLMPYTISKRDSHKGVLKSESMTHVLYVRHHAKKQHLAEATSISENQTYTLSNIARALLSVSHSKFEIL